MKFIDTHAHLYDTKYTDDIAKVIKACNNTHIHQIYMPNLSLESIAPMLDIVAHYPTTCKAMLGLHPCEIKEDYQQKLDQLTPWFELHDFVAIGEVGIDLYWDKTYRQEQIAAFHVFIDWAYKYDLPLIIHARDSLTKIIDILADRQKGHLRGIFHCFTGTKAQAEKAITLGFSLGIGGILTFKKSHLPSIVADIPLEHLVLETDSPFLAPMPYRGKRNTPAYLPYIAKKIADIQSVDITHVAEITTHNALRIFKG